MKILQQKCSSSFLSIPFKFLVCCFLIISIFPCAIYSSFCSESAIPFSFEALSGGHPVLGCARPNCFGWGPFGHPLAGANQQPIFHRVNKQSDGYFRKSLAQHTPKPLSDGDAQFYRAQFANCSAGYLGQCLADQQQWVGGIAPIANLPDSDSSRSAADGLFLRCCHLSVSRLSFSIDRGIATVKRGQIVYGGEVLHGDRQYAFDYIGDIVLRVPSRDNRAPPHYEVRMQRMPCLPRPEQLRAQVEPGVAKELLHKFALDANQQLQLLEKQQRGEQHWQQQFLSQIGNNQIGSIKSSGKSKTVHEGQAKAIKTSELSSPVDEHNQHIGQLPAGLTQQQQGKGDDRPKSFAAKTQPQNIGGDGIEGPFAENDIGEEQKQEREMEEYNDQHQEQDKEGQREQIKGGGGQTKLAPRPKGDSLRKRIICDRNITRATVAASRARRQAECVEVEVPEGTQLEIEGAEGNNYVDPYPVQQQYWYPVSSGGTTGGSLWCFSGDTEVQLSTGKRQRMDRLAIGDWIRTTDRSRLVFSIVESWIHRLPQEWADFVRIELPGGRVLKLTDQHFIYRSRTATSSCTTNSPNEHQQLAALPIHRAFAQAEMVYAEQIRPGDCLFVQHGESENGLLLQQPVLSVGTVKQMGIFAPLTGTGEILVNGVLASCFSREPSALLQRSVFNTINSFYVPILGNILFGQRHIEDQQAQVEFPAWLQLMTEYLLPVVLPK